MHPLLTYTDLFLVPVYILAIYLIARAYCSKYYTDKWISNIFIICLLIKISGGLLHSIIYVTFFEGGDTTGYYDSSLVLLQLFETDIGLFFKMLGGFVYYEDLDAFTMTTGKPLYINKPYSFSVVRYTALFTFLGMNLFFTTTVLVAAFGFIGNWLLYRSLCFHCPSCKKILIVPIMLIPSTFLFASGITKETYLLFAIGLMLYGVTRLFFIKKSLIAGLCMIIISSYLVLSMRPYIFVFLLIAISVWLFIVEIRKIKGRILKLIILPFMLSLFLGIGYFTVNYFITSEDMQVHSWADISDRIEFHRQGFIFNSESPEKETIESEVPNFGNALFSGAFKPLVWDGDNWLMTILGLENLVVLILSIIILFLSIPFSINVTYNSPIIAFLLVFSLLVLLIIGYAVPNLGTACRFRAIATPFYLSGLAILLNNILIYRKKTN